jgi:glycosyltransferase involved in cell wall biosynthesis
MKIANIILTSTNGGAEQVFIDYIRALKNLGHEVSAIVKPDAPYIGKVAEFCSKIGTTTNSLGFYDFIAVRNIKKYLEEFDADAVFVHTGRASALTLKAVKKITKKKVFTVAINHSMNVKRSIGADLVLSVNKKIFYRTIDFGQKQDRSFVVHNAVSLHDKNDSEVKIDLPRKPEITIGVMGRFDEIKAFHFAILALKKIKEKNLSKKFHLKIAGSGPQEQYLQGLVKELNLQEEVDFVSWVEDKKSFFAQIDIFCLTSLRETFGLVLLEAMKFKTPIISTACDGPKEVLRNEIDALKVELNPAETIDERFAEAILHLSQEEDLAQKLVDSSFIRVQEKFSYAHLEADLKEIVGRVLEIKND